MNTLFSFVKKAIERDQGNLVRSLIFLRLTVLLLTLALLGGIHLFYAPLSEWTFTAFILFVPTVCLVLLWSLVVLTRSRLLLTRHSLLRELTIDYGWVFLVVMMTGRSANPFIYYYLVLTAVGATTLPVRQAWYLCVTGVGIYSGVLVLDLSQHFHHLTTDYRLHLSGMWLHYVVSALVACFFITRLSKLLRTQQEDLNRAREENLKNEQLIGVATVAASAVHTLATPISTLGVVTEEIINSPEVSGEVRKDAELMKAQIARCRSIMNDLASMAQQASGDKRESIVDLLTFLREHYSLHSPGKIPAFHCEGVIAEQHIRCNDLLHYALINLINNAIESSEIPPQITFALNENHILIHIENDSALSAEQITQRWGKPTDSEKTEGLGIGSFLANSTIEKQGGRVSLETQLRDTGKTHITVTIVFPKADS